MRDEEKLLLVGPAAVFGYALAARVCAHALAAWPSSSFIWYLNLEVFRPLHYLENFSPMIETPGGGQLTQLGWIVAPLIALICIGLVFRNKFPLAIAAHLSLLYSGVILYCNSIALSAVSAERAELWRAPGFLAAVVFLASFISASISHRLYWREILS
jgi:hypothetical protein